MKAQLYLGECLSILSDVSTFPDNSVDSIVTDPPYGLSFMNKKWDYDVPSVEVWAECLRILKPGGHLLAFAGTRTQHRMAVNIEDAGFEIRDMVSFLYDTSETAQTLIESLSPEQLKLLDATFGRDGMMAWTYGSGFPKSHNLDGEWQGWGTALKPALEPITVARKPFKGTVAANVLIHGTGALGIDACRIPTDENLNGGAYAKSGKRGSLEGDLREGAAQGMFQAGKTADTDYVQPVGRWPANIIHDGSDAVMAAFPANTGAAAPVKGTEASAASTGNVTGKRARVKGSFHGDSGSAARFFYCAKASKKGRGEGNNHPTVKPTELMAYLCRLVTPPGGIVLDPFMGSGSTGKAALREGFQFIGIEMDDAYYKIAEQRIGAAKIPTQDQCNTSTEQLTLFSEGAA